MSFGGHAQDFNRKLKENRVARNSNRQVKSNGNLLSPAELSLKKNHSLKNKK